MQPGCKMRGRNVEKWMHGVRFLKEFSPDTFSRGLCLLLELREELYTSDDGKMRALYYLHRRVSIWGLSEKTSI